MKNQTSKGDTIDIVTPAGGLLSGQFALIGVLGGVAGITSAQGEKNVLHREGVFTLPKATGATWTQGDQLYWDATNKVFTKTSAGNTAKGSAGADAATGDATGSVVLDR